MKPDQSDDSLMRGLTIALVLLATIALEQATLDPDRSRPVGLLSSLLIFALPTIIGSRCLHSKRISPAFFLLPLFALPFMSAPIRFLAFGHRSMLEILLLAALRNLGLGLVVLRGSAQLTRLAALVSLFLATTSASVGGEAGLFVQIPLVFYALTGIIWLSLGHWSKLAPQAAIHGTGARFPLSTITAFLAMIMALAGLLYVGPMRAATVLAGFMPTSGGADANDPDARSGVGDGDNEVAASQDPRSVGFTQSEIYLETDRPSLYDASNEAYGEPFKPRKQEKMIAIGPQDTIEQKSRPSENLQPGREFSTVRNKPRPQSRNPEDRDARALVYVKGPTPLHLPLSSFCHFDGTRWTEEPGCNHPFMVEQEPGGSWLRFPLPKASFLVGSVSHQVKIGTLDSEPIPAPAHLSRFRVGAVNRLDFFGWAQLGIVRMVDRTVPAGTMIDTEASTVDPSRLRRLEFSPNPMTTTDAHVLFASDYRVDPRVTALAHQWVDNIPPGWRQVESIIDHLRHHARHDRTHTATQNSTDVVADFLFDTRVGPDYLFASSAVVLLRSLGYPTRLVSGLYAPPEQYDPKSNHTPVTSQNMHVWPEVRIPSGTWVTLEPTPGYEVLPPVIPWTERLALMLLDFARLLRRHIILVLSLGASLALAWSRRALLIDRLVTLIYHIQPRGNPRRFVMRSLALLERRARLAGRQRPPSATLSHWYLKATSGHSDEPHALLRQFVALADWAAHAPHDPDTHSPTLGHDLASLCKQALRTWNLPRLRASLPTNIHENGNA